MLNFDRSSLKRALYGEKIIPIPNLNDLLYIEDLDRTYEVFTGKRFRYLEQKYSSHFYLYEDETDPLTKQTLAIVRKPLKPKYERIFHLKLNEPLPKTLNGIIENFQLIIKDSLLPKLFECTKTKNCKYSTT